MYWLERGGSRNQLIYLRSAPLSVASILAEELFAKPTSVIMTSATLTRKGSAATFSKQIGAEDVPQCLVSSPFDYEKNLSISILNDFPEPMRGDRMNYSNTWWRRFFSFQAKSGGTLFFLPIMLICIIVMSSSAQDGLKPTDPFMLREKNSPVQSWRKK